MISITAVAIVSTLFISHVLKLLQAKNKVDSFVSDLLIFALVLLLSFFTSHSYIEGVLVALVVGISAFGSQTPSRIVTLIALLTHFADILHELLYKILGRNKKHDKNWEKIQRNEVRETFLHFLELKKKSLSELPYINSYEENHLRGDLSKE
jgi:hypothetical protein